MAWEFRNGLVWFFLHINGSVGFGFKAKKPNRIHCYGLLQNVSLSKQLVWSNYAIGKIQYSRKFLMHIEGVERGTKPGRIDQVIYSSCLLIGFASQFVRLRRIDQNETIKSSIRNAYLIRFASRLVRFDQCICHSHESFVRSEKQREKSFGNKTSFCFLGSYPEYFFLKVLLDDRNQPPPKKHTTQKE